jgi:hypothetical protein
MMHNQASRRRFKHRVSAGLLGVFSISDIGTDGWAATLHVSGVVTDSKDLVEVKMVYGKCSFFFFLFFVKFLKTFFFKFFQTFSWP